MKSVLCVISEPPYASSHDLELMETAMVAAVFDFSVSVLFRDDGVWALLNDQDGSNIGRKTFEKLLQALPTYEIDHIYACAESLSKRGVKVGDSVTPLTYAGQAKLIAEHEAVVGAQA